VGECFFWYWPTRVVPDQRPLNRLVCVCVYNFATIRGRKMCDMSNLLSVTLLLDSYLAVTLVKDQG